MSIAPPPSNSSASSTTDVAPTYTTSKVLEGHEPNIPASVDDKYREGLEDPSKRPAENINAQEDFIKTLPRKDVSFGAQAALDRDRVPLVKRTEVHAVPAETSTENLLKDKQVSASDVQITPTESQSKLSKSTNPYKPSDMLSKIASSTSSTKSKQTSTESSNLTDNLSKQDKQWEESANRYQENDSSSSSKGDSDLSSNETSALHSKFTNQLSKQDKELEESAKKHQEKILEHKEDKEIIPLQKDGSFQAQKPESTKESTKDKLLDTKDTITSTLKQSSSKQDSTPTENVSLADRVETLKDNVKDKLMEAKDTVQNTLTKSKQDSQAMKEDAQDTLRDTKDEITSQLKQYQSKPDVSWTERAEILKENIKEKAMEAKDVVQNTLTKSKSKDKQTESSTAKTWEEKHIEPFDIPRTSTEKQETREKPESSTSESTDSVLPTDQYDLKVASGREPSDTTLEDTSKIEPKQHFITDTAAGLVHIVTHDLPERAKELFNKSQESSSQSDTPSSDGVLPTDQYDLQMDRQRDREPTKLADTTKSTEKIMEEKHVEPFDDHKTEPKHHFIQDKIADLVHTMANIPARAKEFITKHEEKKSQPPSPREVPTIQEREEKSQEQSSSLVKQREFSPEEVSFF